MNKDTRFTVRYPESRDEADRDEQLPIELLGDIEQLRAEESKELATLELWGYPRNY